MTNPVVAADIRYTWHPYTQHYGRLDPIEIVRAEGAYLYTRDGRKIFDSISSWWVTTHGHGCPEIADAIARQARTLEHVIFTNFTHEPAALFAQELVERLPEGLNRVFYSDDGSTAVEAGVKMALQYHANQGRSRTLIVAFDQSYHGDTFGAMSVSARGVFTAPFAAHLFNVHHISNPTQGDTIAELDAVLERHADDIAAIIVEPLLMGSGGMLMYDEQILRDLRTRANQHDIILIADEVATGFGRTGPLFACDRAGIAPDVMCLSKGITGGFLPLGVTVAQERIFDSFLSDDRRRTLFHGHSYTANPIVCASARAALQLYDDRSAQQRAMIEQVHRQQMQRLSAHAMVVNPRILGTVAAFDVNTEAGYLNPVGLELAKFAMRHDVLLRPLGSAVYLLPPYCATADDLAHVYWVIEQFLDSL